MKHVLFITSYAPSLINFRGSLIKKLLSRGCKVSVAAPSHEFTDVLKNELTKLSVKINIFSLSRTGLSPFEDYKSYQELCFILKSCRPDIVLAYTAKPVIYAGLLLKHFPKIDYFPIISGLGYAFTEGDSIRRKILKILMIKLYRIGLKRARKIIFQNIDDQNLFKKLKIVAKKNLTHVINGSGVDLNVYPFSPMPSKPIFLMMSRLLIDKGLREYVEAARIVRFSFPNVLFQLAGKLDENHSGIKFNELQSWIDQGNIKYLGHINSVQFILKSCKFYVLPSYREGTPRSVLEALATGRPIITTNVAGCRETVIHEKNGLLVPAKNPKALADAMIKLLKEKKEKIQDMANQSFLIAKNKYDVRKVNKSILKIINI